MDPWDHWQMPRQGADACPARTLQVNSVATFVRRAGRISTSIPRAVAACRAQAKA